MEAHLKRMARFIGFTEEDADLVRKTCPFILNHEEEITKAVYDHLLESPGTSHYFRKPDGSVDEERIAMRRKGLARWLARSAEACLDHSFAWHMVAMGVSHSHRVQKPGGKIPGSFMVGTMSFTQTALGQILWSDLEDKELAARASVAWNKLLMLELDLLLTGYYALSDDGTTAGLGS